LADNPDMDAGPAIQKQPSPRVTLEAFVHATLLCSPVYGCIALANGTAPPVAISVGGASALIILAVGLAGQRWLGWSDPGTEFAAPAVALCTAIRPDTTVVPVCLCAACCVLLFVPFCWMFKACHLHHQPRRSHPPGPSLLDADIDGPTSVAR
jgi:hypothetical protein